MKRIFSIALCMTFLAFSFATDNRVLLTIDGQGVTVDEFLRIYNKNNNLPTQTEEKSMDDYMDLFINYKLKVIEAEHKGYDTIQSFVKELEGYRDQLSKPYLENKELEDELMKEAYQHYIVEVNASHVLVAVEEFAMPADTLAAWNKAMKIRARLLAGEPFEEVAVATSDDPSAKGNDQVKGNGGNMGWFGAFRMVYPFEKATYELDPGEISMPVRSQFGYHIIRLNDKRNHRGRIRASHIWVQAGRNPSDFEKEAARKKIDKAWQELENGSSWNDVVQAYSEHEPTKMQGGDFGWLQTNSIIAEFLDSCYAVEFGQYSRLFETEFGFHIVKSTDTLPVESYEEAKAILDRGIKRDNSRKALVQKITQQQLEAKYDIKRYNPDFTQLVELIDSTIYTRKWNPDTAKGLTGVLFSFEGNDYTYADFAQFVVGPKMVRSDGIMEHVWKVYQDFYQKALVDFQKEKLKVEKPEYANLYKEYYEGILLFNISNDEVWEKASKDTAGLEAYYAGLKDKPMWGKRLDVTIYTFNDSLDIASLTNAAKLAANGKIDNDELLAKVCPDSVNCLKISHKLVESKDAAWVDSLTWKKNTYVLTQNKNDNQLYYVNKVLKAMEKTLQDARGLYIADYQTYLEKQWIVSLRDKYNYTINTEILSEIKAAENQN